MNLKYIILREGFIKKINYMGWDKDTLKMVTFTMDNFERISSTGKEF